MVLDLSILIEAWHVTLPGNSVENLAGHRLDRKCSRKFNSESESDERILDIVA